MNLRISTLLVLDSNCQILPNHPWVHPHTQQDLGPSQLGLKQMERPGIALSQGPGASRPPWCPAAPGPSPGAPWGAPLSEGGSQAETKPAEKPSLGALGCISCSPSKSWGGCHFPTVILPHPSPPLGVAVGVGGWKGHHSSHRLCHPCPAPHSASRRTQPGRLAIG